MAAIVVSIAEGKYTNKDAVSNVIQYACRLNNPSLIGGYGIVLTNIDDVVEQFYTVKRVFGINDGKQVMHFIFSIERTLYLKPEHAQDLGYMLGKYFANERQVLFAVHNDTKCLHIHMVVNTISFLNGSYRGYWDITELKSYANICINKLIDKVWFRK